MILLRFRRHRRGRPSRPGNAMFPIWPTCGLNRSPSECRVRRVCPRWHDQRVRCRGILLEASSAPLLEPTRRVTTRSGWPRCSAVHALRRVCEKSKSLRTLPSRCRRTLHRRKPDTATGPTTTTTMASITKPMEKNTRRAGPAGRTKPARTKQAS